MPNSHKRVADTERQPLPPAARFLHIDIVRGVALFGVLLVNIDSGFRGPLLEHIAGVDAGPNGQADPAVKFLVTAALEFKALTIFSFLFGVGVAIQAERFALKAAVVLAARRLGWLFVIGLVHLLFIWNGDILVLYSVCGLLLLPALRLPWPALLAIGALAMAVARLVPFGLSLPSGDEATALIAQARQIYGHGDIFSIQRFRWHETWTLIAPLLIGILPRTAVFMYLGMAAWRSGVLREPQRHRGKLWAALWIALPLGLANPSIPALLSLAYLTALLLCLDTNRARSMRGLAALGQMAFTNYLAQSAILGFIFYGYGLGLFGRTGAAKAALIGVAIYAVQMQLSRLWLSRFRFGPVEWLWRSLTYGAFQPMLNGVAKS